MIGLVPGGGDVVDRVKQRQVARLLPEDRIRRRRREPHEVGVGLVRLQPRVEGLAVPFDRFLGRPRRLDVDFPGHRVELLHDLRDVG